MKPNVFPTIKADCEMVEHLAFAIVRVVTVAKEAIAFAELHASSDLMAAVTESAVVAAGFTKVCEGDMPEYLSPESQRGGPVGQIRWKPWMGCDGWSLEYNDTLLPPFETMSQLRSACYGLGIELLAKGGDAAK